MLAANQILNSFWYNHPEIIQFQDDFFIVDLEKGEIIWQKKNLQQKYVSIVQQRFLMEQKCVQIAGKK